MLLWEISLSFDHFYHLMDEEQVDFVDRFRSKDRLNDNCHLVHENFDVDHPYFNPNREKKNEVKSCLKSFQIVFLSNICLRIVFEWQDRVSTWLMI